MSENQKQASLQECNAQMMETIANQRKVVEMKGPAGQIKVPVTEVAMYRQKGYVEVVGNTLAEAANASVSESTETGTGKGDNSETENAGTENEGGSGSEEETVNFESYTDEQLQEFVAIAGLPGTVKKRETIIAKLTELGFKPETGTGEGE